jgi:calcium-dependent protein kinase
MGQIESKNSTRDTRDTSSNEEIPHYPKNILREIDEAGHRSAQSTHVDSNFWKLATATATGQTHEDSDDQSESNETKSEEVFHRIEMTCGSLNYDIRKVYVFGDLIGNGHFGKVRIAHKKRSPEKLYAIKSIKKKNLNKKELKNLVQEVEILSSLDHPNIVKFHETYQDEMYFHIVMDLCSGQELLESILSEGHLTESKVCKIVHKLLSAVVYCHNMNVCHRDIKPENIIFDGANVSDPEVKLIDFGLACKLTPENSLMNTVLGTPYYIAPEVLQAKGYDIKCDVWSVGAITHLMLTGRPPFDGDSTKEIFNEILTKKINYREFKDAYRLSDEAVDFMKKCLERDVKKRLSSAEALNHDWFKRISREIHANNHLHMNVLYNLRKFSAPGELRKIVLKFLVNNLSHKELNMLKETFKAMDYTQEGFICLKDMEEGFRNVGITISRKEIKSIFKRVDLDMDGKVNYSDFLAAAMDQKQFLIKELIENAFNHFDFDASGFIDIDDLEKALLSTGHEVVHKEDLEKIIAEVANERKISLEQFKALFGY